MSTQSSILDRILLNPQQRDAVVCDRWPQLVFAGAGTGKTRVLTAKIAYLIEHHRVNPYHIFAATFTNKAAAEMRTRVENLAGISCAGMWIGTFHSLCARILRQQAGRIGYAPSFTIYDDNDQMSLIRTVMKELEIDERTMQPRHALNLVSTFKNACMTPSDCAPNAQGYYQKEIVRVYERYQSRLHEQQAMDFDDLISNTVYLLRRDAEVRQRYQDMFRYVLVDEYQDTNTSQSMLVRILGGSHGRVFVVGDDDQSIYGWRGAQIENILSFEKHFSGTTVFKLEQNYRSSQRILDFANAVIGYNGRRAAKTLWTERTGGMEVAVSRYGDDRQEAEQVVECAARLAGTGTRLGRMAVLFRTNAQSRVFEDALRKRNMPYVVVGGMSFYERKEIKDCLAYLRLVINAKDDVSCDRILNVPSRGIGAKSRDMLVARARAAHCSMMEAILTGEFGEAEGKSHKGFESLRELFMHLREMAQGGAGPDAILDEMLTLSGYVDSLEEEGTDEADGRLENINELLNAVAARRKEKPGLTLAEFLEEVTLTSDIDRWSETQDAINLMTLHCAKGLEFSIVFLVGLEDGLLPSRQNFDDNAKIEEECRLLYVGCTRAMDRLFCSHTDQRWRFGSLMPMTPSRFLAQVPETLYTFFDHTKAAAAYEKISAATPHVPRRQEREVRRQTPREQAYDEYSQEEIQYRIGQHVVHRNYGRGKILSVSGFGPDMRLTILFHDGTRKKLMARFANLETP